MQQRFLSSLLRLLIVCRNLFCYLCSSRYDNHHKIDTYNTKNVYYVSVTSSLLLSALLLQYCRESSVLLYVG
jgi:transposase